VPWRKLAAQLYGICAYFVTGADRILQYFTTQSSSGGYRDIKMQLLRLKVRIVDMPPIFDTACRAMIAILLEFKSINYRKMGIHELSWSRIYHWQKSFA